MNDKERKELEEQGFYHEPNSLENETHYQSGENQPRGGSMPEFVEVPQQDERGKFFGLGIASMVMGIVSILCCCFLGAPIILAVLALIFSILRMSSKPDGFSIAGLVTGIIGVIFNALMLVVVFSGDFEMTLEELESMLESIDVAVKMFIVK